MRSITLILITSILTSIFALFIFFPTSGKAIEDESLVMYLPFEEGSGDQTMDLSGNENTGEVNEAEWIEDGKRGKALFFDGESSFVEVSDSESLNMGDAITIEAWIFAESHPGTYPRIVMKGYGTAYELDTKNTNSVDWEANIGGWHECNSGDNTIVLRQWHHVAGTFDGEAMKVYIDGEEMNSCAFAGKLGTTGDVLQIGGYTPQNSTHFNGIIDEVAIYSRALNEDEINQDMTEGVMPLAVNNLDKLATTWCNIKIGY